MRLIRNDIIYSKRFRKIESNWVQRLVNEVNKNFVKLSLVEFSFWDEYLAVLLLNYKWWGKNFVKLGLEISEWDEYLFDNIFFFDYWIINNGRKNFVKLSLL